MSPSSGTESFELLTSAADQLSSTSGTTGLLPHSTRRDSAAPFKAPGVPADYREDSPSESFPSMKLLTFIRGASLAGALTITHAAVAFGATAQAATTHATSVAKAHV